MCVCVTQNIFGDSMVAVMNLGDSANSLCLLD